VKFLLIDVTSQESVDAAYKQFSSEQSHLDVLVNNAGICVEAMDTPAAAANVDVFSYQNHYCYYADLINILYRQ
jgi:NAD(P)-dependent dehydrogenase (short-subunit alcohol dehydrogenase family)